MCREVLGCVWWNMLEGRVKSMSELETRGLDDWVVCTTQPASFQAELTVHKAPRIL